MQIAAKQLAFFYDDLLDWDGADSVSIQEFDQRHFVIQSAIAETTGEWFRNYEPLKWD